MVENHLNHIHINSQFLVFKKNKTELQPPCCRWFALESNVSSVFLQRTASMDLRSQSIGSTWAQTSQRLVALPSSQELHSQGRKGEALDLHGSWELCHPRSFSSLRDLALEQLYYMVTGLGPKTCSAGPLCVNSSGETGYFHLNGFNQMYLFRRKACKRPAPRKMTLKRIKF